jgi:hypothetical protein
LLALTGALIAAYFEPSHCVRGWLWGEAFFDGRPTSFWRGVVVHDITHGVPDLGDAQAPPPNWRQTFWSRCKAFIGYQEREFSSVNLLAEKDADGVLQELAGDGAAPIAGFARGALTVRKQLAGQPPACGPGLVVYLSWVELLRQHRVRAADLNGDVP